MSVTEIRTAPAPKLGGARPTPGELVATDIGSQPVRHVGPWGVASVLVQSELAVVLRGV